MSSVATSAPVSPVRAATTLALWAAAWQGGASPDSVLAAIEEVGHKAGVRAVSADGAALSGLPGPGDPSAGSADLLPLLRSGGTPELLLPTAGDLRGLPPSGRITVTALDSGAAVVLPAIGVGVVPADGQWRVGSCPGGHPALDLRTAHQELDEAITTATRRLHQADLSRDGQAARQQVGDIMLAERVSMPPGTPAQAAALLAKAISLQALLTVAAGFETAAINNFELAVVDDALRPLARSVREGRRSAVAAACAELTGQSVSRDRV